MRAIARPPRLLRSIYPNTLWRINETEKIIYLTFDDGPVPGVTTAALSFLKQFNAQATFFCVGENVQQHPDIYANILVDGHTVGNHTHHHTDGWTLSTKAYSQDVQECARSVQSNLFRPPYGRLRQSQLRLLQQHYSVVMWDVLTCDFDQRLTGDDCLQLAVQLTRSGSIVVFHDSIKAKERMLYALPNYLETMSENGWTFSALPVRGISLQAPAKQI
jgi:peptidoglycan/xylan/chitin deacetylase (PgdA/CDA1 family)